MVEQSSRVQRRAGPLTVIVAWFFCINAILALVFVPLECDARRTARIKDVQMSYNLLNYIEHQMSVAGESSSNRPWSVFVSPGRNTANLQVYGMTNVMEQEKVLSAMREWQATNWNMKTLSVYFRKQRNANNNYGVPPLLRKVEGISSDGHPAPGESD